MPHATPGTYTFPIPNNTPPGTYNVSVKAILGKDTCMTISTQVTIHPNPDLPELEVDYTCEPFSAHITTDPDQNVAWEDPNGNYVGYLSEFYAGLPGDYIARITTVYGCSIADTVTVLAPPNADILTGCYMLCDTLLKQDTICLQPPPGSFERWAWTLDGNVLLGGSGTAQPLCLTTDMGGKILFTLVKEYNNENIDDISCEVVSDTFCLEILECGQQECIAPTVTVYYSSSGFQCVLGGDDFAEQIAIIDNLHLVIPSGYHYCGNPPEITGGYFNTTVGVVGNNIYLNGYLHITDPDAYANGLQGTIKVCKNGTNEECIAPFQLPENTCDENIWCMLMPDEPTIIPDVVIGSTHYGIATFSIPLHFVNGPECNITQYTIKLWTYPNYDSLTQVICSGIPNPSIDTMCFVTIQVPLEKFKKLDCLYFDITTNCDLNCAIGDFCFSDLQRRALERSKKVKADILSSLELIPNPVSDILSINYSIAEEQPGVIGIEITNVLGQTVFRQFDSSAQGNLQVDVSDWQAGVYLVNLVTGDKKIAVKKLVKQ